MTAANACTAEALGTAATGGTIDEATFCSAYDVLSGAAAEEAQTLLDCYAAAYDGADCTSSEGLSAASDAVVACNN